MKNNKKSISTKIKAFVLGAILVGVVAVTTVFSLTGCNTNTPNKTPILNSQPGDFGDNQNNNNQNNNNQNNNQTNNNQNNNQTQQKTEAQKLKEAFAAFNAAVKEKVAAKAKTTPENVEINYVNIQDGVLVVGCKTQLTSAEYAFKNVAISNLNNISDLSSAVSNSTLLQVIKKNTNELQGCEADVEDALRDAGYIKSSDKVLSLSCSDVAISGAVNEQGKAIYSSFATIVKQSNNGKISKQTVEMRYAGTDLFENVDKAKLAEWDSEKLNDAAVVYEMMKSGNFQGALDYMQGNGME